jgi:heme-degrading monooxygenase HmoA
MFLVLWEFEVKPGTENRFESVYGPGGGWARLFAQDQAYLETRLLRDMHRPGFYLTMDRWESREAYEAFRQSHAAEYAALDAECELLSVQERHIAWCSSEDRR